MENEAQLINKYQAEFENACDDLYYGYGYNFWRTNNNSIEDDNIAKMVWKAAFNKMSASESKTKNMKKSVVKINEEQLKKIVNESVKKVISEIDGKTYAMPHKKLNSPVGNDNYNNYNPFKTHFVTREITPEMFKTLRQEIGKIGYDLENAIKDAQKKYENITTNRQCSLVIEKYPELSKYVSNTEQCINSTLNTFNGFKKGLLRYYPPIRPNSLDLF